MVFCVFVVSLLTFSFVYKVFDHGMPVWSKQSETTGPLFKYTYSLKMLIKTLTMHIKTNTVTFAKIFFSVTVTGFLLYIILAMYTFHTAYFKITELKEIEPELKAIQETDKDLKYILIWTSWRTYPFNKLLEGQATFINKRCPYINCFITDNKTLLNGDYKNFEVIMFNSVDLRRLRYKLFPKSRSTHQKYVFVGKESSEHYPVCSIKSENFFNWTWTYKLKSDIVSPFIEIRDSQGTVIGPKLNMTWQTDLLPAAEYIKVKAKTKFKAVVWLSTECETRNNINNMRLVESLKTHLRDLQLTLDIFGPCGSVSCENNSISDCLKMIDRDYYFFIAFEDSYIEQYVTSYIVLALNNNVVPIVSGGYDYSNFLPPGSYLQIDRNSLERVAAHIDFAIRNPSAYSEFFEWHDYYSFHEMEGVGNECTLCSMLNNEEIFSRTTEYCNFRRWWYDAPLSVRCLPSGNRHYKMNSTKKYV